MVQTRAHSSATESSESTGATEAAGAPRHSDSYRDGGFDDENGCGGAEHELAYVDPDLPDDPDDDIGDIIDSDDEADEIFDSPRARGRVGGRAIACAIPCINIYG